MSTSKKFVWSKKEYSMRKFVDIYSYRLPIVVLLVVGWSGKDEEHTFSGGEIYRIGSVKRQKRIVAKHDSGYFVSIPTTVNKKVDIYFPDGTVRKSADMSDVLAALKIHDDGSLKLMFENDEKVSFSFGQDKGDEINFGQMKVIDVYDERYLVGHSLCEGNVYSPVMPVTIPVYMTIQLSTAVGLVGGTKEDFCKVLADIEDQMKDAVTEVEHNDEIMLFPHDISESDYEYIRPCSSIAAILRGSDFDMDQPDMTSSPAYCAHKNPSPADLFSRTPTQSISRKPPAPSPVRVYKPPPPKPTTSGQVTQGIMAKIVQRINASWKQQPPDPPTANNPQMSPTSGQVTQGIMAKIVQRKSASRKQLPPDPPPANNPPMSPTSGQVTQGIVAKTDQRKSVSGKQLLPDPTPVIIPAEKTTHGGNYDYVYTHKSGTTRNRLKEFETLNDVPSDIRTLTQKQLVTCMRMLKIAEHCVCSLVEQDVDGNILVSLDESILAEEFRFSRFDAIKLMRFAKEGYRPHVNH